jgi:hypothetical protein
MMASEPEMSAWVPAEDGWNHIDGFASEHSSDLDDDQHSNVKSWVSDDDQCEREVKWHLDNPHIVQLCNANLNTGHTCMFNT